jgi:hypothetical protein
MQLEKYKLETEDSATVYEFISTGPKGSIAKIIQFQTTANPQLFNLAFGDKDLLNGEIDDYVISDNGDTDKVLATVVDALFRFLELYWGVWVYATGSTKSRTRLYRMGITKYYHQIEPNFELLGYKDDNWQPFVKGIDYEAFLIKKKNH